MNRGFSIYYRGGRCYNIHVVSGHTWKSSCSISSESRALPEGHENVPWVTNTFTHSRTRPSPSFPILLNSSIASLCQSTFFFGSSCQNRRPTAAKTHAQSTPRTNQWICVASFSVPLKSESQLNPGLVLRSKCVPLLCTYFQDLRPARTLFSRPSPEAKQAVQRILKSSALSISHIILDVVE